MISSFSFNLSGYLLQVFTDKRYGKKWVKSHPGEFLEISPGPKTWMQFVRHRRTVGIGSLLGRFRNGTIWTNPWISVGFCAPTCGDARLTLNNQGNGTSGHLAVMIVCEFNGSLQDFERLVTKSC